MKCCTPAMCIFCTVTVVACAASSVSADIVRYGLKIDLTWSPETHPIDFPSADSHLTEHVGAGHTSAFTLWELGGLATEGIKNVAERGWPHPLVAEVEAGISAGSAYNVLRMHGLGPAPGIRNHTFSMSSSHPLFSIATMLAPSPDWMAGAHDVNLLEGGRWVEEMILDFWAYDVGTDSGVSYKSPDAPTNPREPISILDSGPFEGSGPIGSYTFRLLTLPGDFDESGKLDEPDIHALCASIGSRNDRLELTGDNVISLSDLNALVEMRFDTRLGDVNLDGEVDFDDFLSLSENYSESGRHWQHGDFNCDSKVDFPDFLLLSHNFGFARQASTTESVPEPAAWLIIASAFGIVVVRSSFGRFPRR